MPTPQHVVNQVKVALKNGTLVRPERCSACGSNRRLHGHHPNYRKPLDVVWLCSPCHKDQHPNPEPPVPNVVSMIALKDAVDLGAERARLKKETDRIKRELEALETHLSTAQFLSKAPASVVTSRRTKKQKLESEYARISESYRKLL